MRFIITGRNIDITEGLKSAVEEKLGKLDRFFAPETEVNVTLSVEKERQKIEVLNIKKWMEFYILFYLLMKRNTILRI